MKCTACHMSRSRLHTCVICAKKLCGCCSFKSTLNSKRTCCYPGSGDTCTKANIAAHKEAQAQDELRRREAGQQRTPSALWKSMAAWGFTEHLVRLEARRGG